MPRGRRASGSEPPAARACRAPHARIDDVAPAGVFHVLASKFAVLSGLRAREGCRFGLLPTLPRAGRGRTAARWAAPRTRTTTGRRAPPSRSCRIRGSGIRRRAGPRRPAASARRRSPRALPGRGQRRRSCPGIGAADRRGRRARAVPRRLLACACPGALPTNPRSARCRARRAPRSARTLSRAGQSGTRARPSRAPARG